MHRLYGPLIASGPETQQWHHLPALQRPPARRLAGLQSNLHTTIQGAGSQQLSRGTFVLTRILILLSLFAGVPRLFAQAGPTASRAGDLLIGAGYTSAESDYGSRYTGFGIYGDFDFSRHFGVEANFHKVNRGNGSTLYEKTYEVGGRYFRTYSIFVPYAKIMVGRGVFNYPPYPPPAPQNQASANLAYNMFAGGLGTDIKVRPYLYLRADFEYQKWPGFKGTIDGPANGLTPELFTFGAAYHFR